MTSVAGSEKTEVVYGSLNVLNTEIQFFSNARLKVDTFCIVIACKPINAMVYQTIPGC
jgi:hypothetical protein